MFIGHMAVGLAAKPLAPRTSLGLLVGATIFLDLLWPILLLLDIEHVRITPGITKFNALDLYDIPWSHSLAMVALWSALAGSVYWWRTRYQAGAWALAGGVASHWVLDWLTHVPDMQLVPGGDRYGLGLWNSVPGTLAVELPMFAAGLWLAVRSTRVRKGWFWSWVGLMVVAYFANAFGPPPPGLKELAWSAMVMWLIPVWLNYADLGPKAAGTAPA